MIRILIADDQTLFREGLSAVLGAHGFAVVGEAADGATAVELAAQLQPDVVLMDLRMPVLDGVAATRRITALPRAPRVLALTTFDDDAALFDVLRAGALGYLLKDAASSELVEAIRLAARGESLLSPATATKLVHEFARTAAQTPSAQRNRAAELGLSERELHVLRLIAQGNANKEIGAQLNIAEGTVKNHVTNIFTKLGVQDRTQAALRARELSLL